MVMSIQFPFHITDDVKDWLSRGDMSPFTALNDLRPFPLQPNKKKSNRGKIWTDLRKLFTIKFQLQNGVDDLQYRKGHSHLF